MSDPVGMIGLGLLGSALAERLIAAGHTVIGFDSVTEARDRFAASAGHVATDVADVARQCRRVVLSLPDAGVSHAVISEMKAQLSLGSIIIDTTTGDPDQMLSIGDDLAAGGFGYLDATIAGSSVQARTGDVLVLIGGDKSHVAASQDLINALSSRSIHVGQRGSGARMKLVVNLVLGLNRAVLAEGLMFAKSQGFDPQTALEVLRQSPAASAVMETKGPKMIAEDFATQARLRQHLKDVRLILDCSAEARTPLSKLHAELLQSLVDNGHGDEDNSAIIRAFQ